MNLFRKGANNFHLAYGFWHLGDGFRTVLFTWYVAIYLNMSAEQVGFLQTLSRSPFLFFLVFGGIISDKLGIFRTFTIVTTLYALALIGVGIATYLGQGSYLVVIGLSIASGLATAISTPAIDTFIPNSTDSSAESNSVDASLIYNSAKLLGTFSNILVSVAGASVGFFVNSVPYILSVVFLSRHVGTGGQANHRPQDNNINRSFGSLRNAFRHLVANPKCGDIVISSALQGLFAAPIGFIILPFVVRQNFPAYIDLLVLPYITYWLGAIAATSAAKRYLKKIVWLGNFSLALLVCGGLAMAALPFVQTFSLVCLVLFAVGFFVSAAKPLIYGYYLKQAPISEKALMVSIDQLAFWIVAIVSINVLGYAMGTWGVNGAVVGNSALFILLVCVLFVRKNIGLIVNEDAYLEPKPNAS